MPKDLVVESVVKNSWFGGQWPWLVGILAIFVITGIILAL